MDTKRVGAPRGAGLPSHLNGVPPLLLGLSVCSPPPVLVGLLVGFLVVIAVLVIYAQGWGQEEVILGLPGAQPAHLPQLGRTWCPEMADGYENLTP